MQFKLSGNLWKHRDFLRLWSGDTVSQFGNQITNLAVPTVAYFLLNATVFEIALLGALSLVSFPLLGLFAGVWVDRWKRRPVMIVCNLGRMGVLGSIPVAFFLGALSMYQLYAVALINGVFTVFFDVAYQSYLPSLIDRADLVEGNSKLQTSASGAQVAGPTVAGFLITIVGSAQSILVDAFGYLFSALMLFSIKKKEEKPQSHLPGQTPNFFGEMKEGVLVVFKNPILTRIAGCTATSNLGTSILFAVYLYFAYSMLKITPLDVGFVGTAGAIAFLIGVLYSSRVSKRLGVGWSLAISISTDLLFLATPLAMYGPPIPILMAVFFLGSLGSPIYNIVQVSLRQAITPDRVQGRMNATMRTIVWGTLPLGSFVGGILGSTVGLVMTIVIGAAIAGAAGLWILLGPVIDLKDQPTQVVGE